MVEGMGDDRRRLGDFARFFTYQHFARNGVDGPRGDIR